MSPLLQIDADLTGLSQHILRFVAETGRPADEVARMALKTMVKLAINETPPGSRNNTGLRAKQIGELAISRDLRLMGFEPVTITGQKIYQQTFWGHTLKAPLVIPTKINPKFADPWTIYRARIASSGKMGRHGRISRGGKQAWYVDVTLFNQMRKELFSRVGKLASGWVPAAIELGIPVPAWIKRHGGEGRGTTVLSEITDATITLTVINHFPESANAVYEVTIRLIPYWIREATARLNRQLEAKLEGLWNRP